MMYRALLVLAFITVIVGSVMLGRQRGTADRVDDTAQSAGQLGYSALNARLIETGDDGRPMYTLDADAIRQNPNEGAVALEAVRMSVLAEDGHLWMLRADRGELREDATRIDLFGDVRVSGVLPPEAEPAEIRSEMLTFNTETEVVTTSAPVTLEWSGRQLQAVGLVANLKDRRVQLESKVHGRFLP